MSYDSDALLKVLARFARLLPTEYDVPTALDELVDGVATVLDLAGAGVSLYTDGQLRFVTAPNEAIAAIERCQEATREGPCMEAFESGVPVPVADLTAHMDRWPNYTTVAAEHGIVSAMGIPMHLGEPVGVVNLYDVTRREWKPAEIEAARVLADIATGYVVNADKRRQQQQLMEQLQHALKSRVVIEQAKGVIATTNDITTDEAFETIRRYARQKQLRLHAVAAAIVDAGLRL
ncbi:GAF and ANTAR domain-containing protein [Nocardia sp. NPDC055321]